MKYTMPVDKVVATKAGHAIDFKAGVPTHVPKECWREVTAAGAVPEDQAAVQKAQATTLKKAVVEDPIERKERIFAAFTSMVETNKRGDFAASGVPHHKALEQLTGFDVDPHERDDLWVEFQQLSTDGEGAAAAAKASADAAAKAALAADAAAAAKAAADKAAAAQGDAEKAAAEKAAAEKAAAEKEAKGKSKGKGKGK